MLINRRALLITVMESKNSDGLDYNMIDFHPANNPDRHDYDSQTLNYCIKMNNCYDPQRRQSFFARIKKWIMETVAACKADVVLPVPGHSPSSDQTVWDDILGLFCKKVIVRTIEVQKSTQGGPRDKGRHKETMKVTKPDEVQGRIVLIVDDIWTSGATMNACRELVMEAGAKKVFTAAVGKTVSSYF